MDKVMKIDIELDMDVDADIDTDMHVPRKGKRIEKTCVFIIQRGLFSKKSKINPNPHWE
jgi:hypothetical protein